MRVKKIGKTSLNNAMILLFIGFLVLPIFWIFTMSFKQFVDIISYPPKFIFSPTIENYRQVFASEFPRFLLNSIIITGGAIFVGAITGVPAAYALAQANWRKKEDLAFTFLSFRFAPEFAVILPLFAIYQTLHLYDTYVGMILVHELIVLPLIIWICRGFFSDVPVAINEAAIIDGATHWQRLRYVYIPIAAPGLVSAGIIAFISSWNNLLFGLVLSGKATQPVTMGILQAMTFNQIKWGEMAASACVAAIPGIIFAVYLQKYLIKGITVGAIKE
ncbi:unannotated protein [freshwater metagenome]|uniref:Unannotated protein n=1 Tax=freshwater metagenome TaxID=449393 RepID=A0A6J7A8J3_9ZZZZ|nr:ABC transporter permease subunit [Actinomycetota bacterium]